MKKHKVLIVSENSFQGIILAKGLEPYYRPLFVNHCDFVKGFMNGAFSRQIGNKDIIVLVGYKEQETGDIIWQRIRKKPGALHPILVCGYESHEYFHSRHIEFTERVSRYHRYRQMPWSQVEVREDIGELNPLFDDNHRKDLYAIYGQEDMRQRLPRLMHELKGVDCKRELRRAEYLRKLVSELNNEKVNNLINSMIEQLKVGRLDQVQDLRESINKNL